MRYKVSLEKCGDYKYNDLKKTIIKSFDNLGGIYKYLKKGERVLLKINLLIKSKPEDAVTVHPVFVRALSEVILDAGMSIIIGDSPGGPFNKTYLRGIYKQTGMTAIVSELKEYIKDKHLSVSVKLNDNFKTYERKVKNGKIVKSLTLTDMLNDVDKVISVAKLKTHGMMTFTGAVKNLFGTVPGVLKVEYHFKMSKYEDFANMLIDINETVKPVLTFTDAIVGMEGEGPSSGKPRKIGVVISSNSSYHSDMIAADIINLKHLKVPTIKEAVRRGLCNSDYSDMELIGNSVSEVKIKDFDIPQSVGLHFAGRGPKFFQKFLDSLLRPKPVFKEKGCIGCKICYDACPPKAIYMEKNKAKVKLNACIRCFCCHELCPEKTIDIHRPVLMKLLARL